MQDDERGPALVRCVVCDRSKKPVGRNAPLEMGSSLCDEECLGYRVEPLPSSLWPGEAGPLAKGL